jgi:hypothetical protein
MMEIEPSESDHGAQRDSEHNEKDSQTWFHVYTVATNDRALRGRGPSSWSNYAGNQRSLREAEFAGPKKMSQSFNHFYRFLRYEAGLLGFSGFSH